MHAVIVDPFDSFVYTISQYLSVCGLTNEVVRSPRAKRHLRRSLAPDLIVLGPGPGTPKVSGHVDLVQTYAGQVPILGVCLGHQAIAEAFGGATISARSLVHGKTSQIQHDSLGMFSGVRQHFHATRYNSLVVDPDHIGSGLEVTATSVEDGAVMGLRHGSMKLESVQFHPESIRTEGGIELFQNFIAEYVTPSGVRRKEIAS